VRVVSVRIGIEKSECKVFLPCEQVLVWINEQEVCWSLENLSGSTESLWPSEFGAEQDNLCVGDVNLAYQNTFHTLWNVGGSTITTLMLASEALLRFSCLFLYN
jgi:hypothetical protein